MQRFAVQVCTRSIFYFALFGFLGDGPAESMVTSPSSSSAPLKFIIFEFGDVAEIQEFTFSKLSSYASCPSSAGASGCLVRQLSASSWTFSPAPTRVQPEICVMCKP